MRLSHIPTLGAAHLGTHCEKYSLFTSHLYPDTQLVGPVYPLPPHWVHWKGISTKFMILIMG
jgi:hypothetical protein